MSDKTSQPYSPLFDTISDWIMDQALNSTEITETIQGLGQRLVAGGIPVSQLAVGGMLLHPILGAMDIFWEAKTDQARRIDMPRELFKSQDFRDAPFFHLTSTGEPSLRARLEQGAVEPEFPIYARFCDEGVTDYLAYFFSYGEATRRSGAICRPAMAASAFPWRPNAPAASRISRSNA